MNVLTVSRRAFPFALGALATLLLAAAPTGRYSVDDEVVHDRRTKLVWQRERDTTIRSYDAAEAFCLSASTGGRLGWRVPTLAELQTIVDPRESGPAIDRSAFPEREGETRSQYWTSTPVVDSSGAATDRQWIVDFKEGMTTNVQKSSSLRVRCVIND